MTESGEEIMAKSRSAGKGATQQKGRLAGAAEFVRNVRGELRRVTWPNRDQLQQSTLVVLIILLVLTAFVSLWDLIFYYLATLVFA
jgi:preprotein translocase subunit SecE